MVDEQTEFWSKVAQKYDHVVDSQIGGLTRSMARDRLAREGNLGRAVEFGCGTGFYTDTLASKADSLLATDISPGMLEIAQRRVVSQRITFKVEDCQRTSLSDGAFDTAVLPLVIHFTAPKVTISEMHRILRLGGTLVVISIDPHALVGLARLRSRVRVLYQGVIGYRTKPPKGFGRNVVGNTELREILDRSGFRVASAETIRDSSRTSNIPVLYVRASKT